MDSLPVGFWQQFVTKNALHMISCHDIDGNYLFVTPSCFDLLGYSQNELIEHSAYEFFHVDDLEIIKKSHATIRTTNKGTTIVYRIRKKDGNYTWFESTSKVVDSPDQLSGKIIYSTSNDVSERISYELAKDKIVELLRSTEEPLENWERILTMCAWTGKIKFKNEWIKIEDFLFIQFGIKISHGISPEMYQRILSNKN